MTASHSSRHQRGVSVWTIIGTAMLVAGMAGLGLALFKPGSGARSVAPVAPIATGSDTAAAPTTADTKPAAAGAASTAIAKIESPSSGPHSSWHGTWRGTTPDEELVITAARVGACKWLNATEPRFDGECEAGYAKSSVSLAHISRRFEESVALFQRDPSDFSITDPAQSRRLISRIKPGNYRVIWMQDGSDCGLGDLIVDGDLILRVVDCKYRHQISLLTRQQ